MWKQDSHPAREVTDLGAVACSFFAELLEGVVRGVGGLLDGRDDLLSGMVEAKPVLGVGGDVLECGANIAPLKLHVSLEAFRGSVGDLVDVGDEGTAGICGEFGEVCHSRADRPGGPGV